LIKSKRRVSLKAPDCLEPGQYVLRVEVIGVECNSPSDSVKSRNTNHCLMCRQVTMGLWNVCIF
ncbi:hypothetical protein FA15DRAFT_591784, partial [Coprinopsis marcescibilis]